jgi:3-methyladenine DNA glycosylase AlkD
MQDQAYASFQSRLIPTLGEGEMIGVRTKALRDLAKEIKGTQKAADFMGELPHQYFEENQLHAFLVSEEKDYEACIRELEHFLPYVTNWATCDQMNPKVLKKQPEQLLEKIHQWIASEHTYTIRFAIKLLMDFYLDDHFEPSLLELVCSVSSEEYYVRMMVAWYFQTALVKQYDAAIPYIREHRLPEWTHRKTIQKACESYKVSEEMKEYLRGFVN